MIKKLILFTGLLVSLGITAGAQILNPVHWSYKVENISKDEAVLVFTADIDDKWHLYSQNIPDGGPVPTSFTFKASENYEPEGKVKEVSKGENIFDSSFNMKLTVFSHKAVFKQKIRKKTDMPFSVTGTLEFMCCDDSRCIPPKEMDFSFSLNGKGTSAENSRATTATKKETEESTPQMQSKVNLNVTGVTEGTETKQSVSAAGKTAAKAAPVGKKKSLWIFFFLSMLAGLAGTITPCVFPMIPMTIAFFTRNTGSRTKSILQAFIFGASIMLIYTSVGLIVSLTSAGADFANTLSTHWIPNLIFFILFLIFAAAFLGMFELVLPNSLITKADKQADKGGMLAAFFMGLTTVLVSFSCTGPLVGALLVEASAGEVIKPTIGMFGFGLAFATPFTLLAVFPSWLKGLPKSGGWLNSVEVVLGFIVLAFSMKYLMTIDQTYNLHWISRDVYLAIWIVIFTLMGFYLLGKIKFKKDSDLPYVSFPRLVFVIITFTFVVYLIPGLFGAPLKPISGLLPPMKAQQFNLFTPGNMHNQPIPSKDTPSSLCDEPKYEDLFELPYNLQGYFDYEQGLACARKLNKPLLLDFVGHACSNCKEMESRVWSDPEVLKRLRNDFVLVELYVDDRTRLPENEWVTSSYDGKVKKTIGKINADLEISRFRVNSQPYYVILDPDENVLTPPIGHTLDIRDFIDFLDKGKEAFRKKQ